jgi:prepilin-type N-terminal cleavage/methylation domain-containing protein
MAGRRIRAFTLVELLVVVSIIALLVTMLMPMLQRGVELSRRAACGTNCKEMSRAITTYARQKRFHRGARQQRLPHVGVSSSSWDTGAKANRECMWLLVEHKLLSPGSLQCPSLSKADMDLLHSGDRFGYSYLTMVDREPTLNDLYVSIVIVGDRNPRFAPNSKQPIASALHQNSNSHLFTGRGPEGQNVGRLDESAGWIDVPFVFTGTTTRDYIYESASGGNGSGKVTRADDVLLLN